MDGESSEPVTERISVIDPLSRAIDWATHVLFRPFDFRKWLVLGFCAWLAQCGEGGGGGGGNSGSSWRGGDVDRGEFDRHEFERGMYEAWDWVLAHLTPILLIGACVVIFAVVLWLLVLWLSSRGKFMFLDGVVQNRGAVVEPWHRLRAPANSLFMFRIVLSLIGFSSIVLILAFAGFQVWVYLDSNDSASLLTLGLVLAGLAFAVAVSVFVLIGLAIEDFVVPLMYLNQSGVGPAWRELGSLVAARPGAFVLYVLMKIVLAVVLVVVGIMACCATCCIVALPYVGTVILLPVYVFLRAYPLYFLGQFGPKYARFATLG